MSAVGGVTGTGGGIATALQMHAPAVALALAIVMPVVGAVVAVAYSPPVRAWVLGRNANQVLTVLSASQPFGADHLRAVAAVVQATGGQPSPAVNGDSHASALSP